MSRYRPKQSPANCTYKQCLRMKRDNLDTKTAWCPVDPLSDTVTLCNQKNGHESTGEITMKRKDLAVLARWFLKRVPMSPR